MRVGSFIVTFRRPRILRESIKIVLGQSRPPDALLIVDNGSSPEARSIVQEINDARIIYRDPGDNLGSAGGVSYGISWFHREGFDWIHSCDDDNPPKTHDTLERLVRLAERFKDDGVGAVAAVGSRWDWKKGTYKRLPDEALTGIVEVDVIGGNSHLVVRREAIDTVGAPDPRLFFGFYDPLYCLKLRKAGYRLLIDGDVMLKYRTLAGRLNLKRRKTLLPRDPYHAIWRRYYVTRNYIYMMNSTFHRHDLAKREALRALGRACTSWMRGPRYGNLFTRLQLLGIIDGYRERLGRTVEPVPKYQP